MPSPPSSPVPFPPVSFPTSFCPRTTVLEEGEGGITGSTPPPAKSLAAAAGLSGGGGKKLRITPTIFPLLILFLSKGWAGCTGQRGTISMANLHVSHVVEDTSFASSYGCSSSPSPSRSGSETIVREENDFFSALLRLHCAKNNYKSPLKERGKCSWSRFDAERFVKRVNHSNGMVKAAAAGTMEPTLLRGKKIRINTTINGSYNPAPSGDG
ncbi:unnamed protein product [Linum tenue]|uniref:Uncharacterized protein n=1 Tax=Linum tenue TaxID=586396 RepID=A0AAV0PVX1_9ROSI|nr:unnamed protein product [Linum tenue]